MAAKQSFQKRDNPGSRGPFRERDAHRRSQSRNPVLKKDVRSCAPSHGVAFPQGRNCASVNRVHSGHTWVLRLEAVREGCLDEEQVSAPKGARLATYRNYGISVKALRVHAGKSQCGNASGNTLSVIVVGR